MRSGLMAGALPDGTLPSRLCLCGPDNLFAVTDEDAASVAIAVVDCIGATGATRTRPTEVAENIARP
jgi:hypothetical protein